MTDLKKYPRTRHIEGSRLGPGDADLAAVPWDTVRGCHLVVEEKVDGANAAVSFDAEGRLRLQSRGHYLTGGAREKHFAALKTWAAAHAPVLHARLGSRFVMYGEWLYAKHTVYYDALPHYFLEFDVFDRDTGTFLSTPRRRELLAGSPVVSVPVLAERPFTSLKALTALVGRSKFKSPDWRERLRATAASQGLDVYRVIAETDGSDAMEGLYLKHEIDGVVTDRYKWVRHDFLAAVVASDSHWLSRPIVPNGLAGIVDDLFAP